MTTDVRDAARCLFCQQADDSQKSYPLAQDPICADVWYHYECLHTKAGQKWWNDKRDADPAFRRYWDLMTVALPLHCVACSGEQVMSPKAVGMSVTWELCCDTCSRVQATGISPYEHHNLFNSLNLLRQQFLRVEDTDYSEISAIEEEVQRLAKEKDKRVKNRFCLCGGRFSIAAKPRCVHCNEVVFHSFFHYTYGRHVKN